MELKDVHYKPRVATPRFAPLAAALLLSIPAIAKGQAQPPPSLFDAFFQYVGRDHRVYFQELPGETVDPFSGTLRIVEEDIGLPGKGGLDLRILRTYSSKIWGRVDGLDSGWLLPEADHSVLGYGWTIHMGRLRNPYAPSSSNTCGGQFPVYEAPDGTSQVFYPASSSYGPISGTGVFMSKDFWRLEIPCAFAGSSGATACIWSDKGVRYEIDESNAYTSGLVPVWPVRNIVDTFGNKISVYYSQPDTTFQQLRIRQIVDTYGRPVDFTYDPTPRDDGYRLQSIQAGNKIYSYGYKLYGGQGIQVRGQANLPAGRRFLISVQPPAGPGAAYEYGIDSTLAQNQFALTRITYPTGGSTTYGYDQRAFFTGRETVQFSVVTSRSVASGGPAPAVWQYDYAAPTYGSAMNVTTITRPDGKHDVHTIYGFGWVAGRNQANYTWLVGLTQQISRADGAEIETLQWDPRGDSFLSNVYFAAPSFSSTGCAVESGFYLYDERVYVPAVSKRWVQRDKGTYATESSDFDLYAQPRTVIEKGFQGAFTYDNNPPPTAVRRTDWTYFSAVTDAGVPTPKTVNVLRGRPLSQKVCIGDGCNWSACDLDSCFDNGWGYDPTTFVRTSETRSGVTTAFGYFPPGHTDSGNLNTVTNALGKKLTLSAYSDGNGTPTQLDFNGAFTISRTATFEGWVATEKDGRGNETGFEYDDIGRMKKVTPPMGVFTTYDYAPDNSYVKLQRGLYSKTTSLDGLGRETATTDSENVLTSKRYDAMGRAWFQSYPYQITGEYPDADSAAVGNKLEFDGLGRVMTLTRGYRPQVGTCESPQACTETHWYLASCSGVVLWRAVGDSTENAVCHTLFGDPDEQRLTQVYDAAGGMWAYGYNAAGKLRSVTTPQSPMGDRSFSYDARQYLVAEASGEAGTATYVPNELGQPVTRKDARPIAATNDYTDPLSRLKGTAYGNGSDDDVSWTYDRANNVASVSSVNGGAYDPIVYDEVNRLKTQTWSFSAQAYLTTYGYDSYGCLKTVTYPTGTVLSMDCDSANRVTAIRIGSDVIAQNVTYHPTGQVNGMQFGNGQSTQVTYDWRARVKALTSGVGTADTADIAYEYDGANNVTSYQNLALGTPSRTSPTSKRTMHYDKLDRLWDATASAPWEWQTAAYVYDALGNRLLSSVGSYTTNFTYDAQNRLATADGGQAPLPTMTFKWDAPGRLAWSSDGMTYQYDGRGRRVLKSDGINATVYHYDGGGRLIAETQPNGTKLRDYIYLGNKLIAVDGCITTSPPACNQREWYHTDALGSVVARSNLAGTVVAQFDYQPWGERSYPPTAVVDADGDRQYNGRVYDSGTGFHDYGARLYWPQIGRFISPDTYRGNVANPASLNRYSYVWDNPYKYVDPTGKWPTDTHNRIIDRAFPGLSAEQRQTLKQQSRHVDRAANQTKAGNHDHAMRSPGENPAAAKRAIEQHIHDVEASARGLQGSAPGDAAGIRSEALGAWGEGNHTVMDRTSPAHTDANGDPREGSGIPVTPGEAQALRQHIAEEENISPEQMDAAVKASQDSFRATFGDKAADAATGAK